MREVRQMPEHRDKQLEGFIKDVVKLCRKYSAELSHRETDRRHELRDLVDRWATAQDNEQQK